MIGGEYGGVARVIVRGGRSETSDLQLHSTGADDVLVTCELFANEPSVPALQRLRTHMEGLPTDYDELLRRHVAVHRELFLRTRLDLGGKPRYRALPNERLLEEVRHGRGCNAMMERLFD